MLKHHQTVCLALAGLLTVPVITGQEGDLRARLERTVHSLEEIAGLRQRIREQDRSAVGALIERTGAFEPQSPERTEQLNALRIEVQELQTQLDTLDTVAVERLVDDPSTESVRPGQREEALVGGPLGGAVGSNPVPAEPAGYSADALREARLLIRAKRHQEAFDRLADQGASAEVRYYRARALQGLGRGPEALDLYRQVAAEADAGEFARWADQDARMLELELELAGRQGGSR